MDIAEIIPIILLIGLTFWRRDIFLYLISCPVSIAYGMYWYEKFHHPAGLVFAMALMGIGIYALVLGAYNLIKPGKTGE